MKVLYLRNVPDEVVDELEVLAESEGMSVSAFAVRELSVAAIRARNRKLLEGLPVIRMNWADLVAGIERDRDER
jgi:plasmid stability protein